MLDLNHIALQRLEGVGHYKRFETSFYILMPTGEYEAYPNANLPTDWNRTADEADATFIDWLTPFLRRAT
jgi:hypothetical protein